MRPARLRTLFATVLSTLLAVTLLGSIGDGAASAPRRPAPRPQRRLPTR